ncbi:MAG: hypothetical protein DRG50_03925 [Deltaproteobacteria bacterium]|nr:MAG: hypothetical protein DRG50_03925 [Deltaproteobacteria bacterium]
MKVKVKRGKIIKAMKNLEGVEIILEDANDAKEAIDLILRKTELFKSNHYKRLKDIKVTAIQEYETSAVDYDLAFILEFLFEDDTTADLKIALIKELQDFFEKF